MKRMEKVIIKAGTLIHFQGVPFRLVSDTEMFGLQVNLDMALKFAGLEMTVAAAPEAITSDQ
jgi:hypothetical protein